MNFDISLKMWKVIFNQSGYCIGAFEFDLVDDNTKFNVIYRSDNNCTAVNIIAVSETTALNMANHIYYGVIRHSA